MKENGLSRHGGDQVNWVNWVTLVSRETQRVEVKDKKEPNNE